MRSLLVIQDDVRSPDVVTRHMQHLNSAILLGVPLQLVVAPVLLHPQVGRHDLVLQVLNRDFIGIRDSIVKMYLNEENKNKIT